MKIMSLLLLLIAVGCSHSHKAKHHKADSPVAADAGIPAYSIENAAAKETDSQYFVDIKFDKGSAELSSSAKKAINSIIDKGVNEGEIDELIVLSWSDSAYPGKSVSGLSPAQLKLARERNQAVKKYAKIVSDVKVDTYNMAEKPNALEKWLNTDDKRLKESLEEAGLSTKANAKQFASKASHSVILIKLR